MSAPFPSSQEACDQADWPGFWWDGSDPKTDTGGSRRGKYVRKL